MWGWCFSWGWWSFGHTGHRYPEVHDERPPRTLNVQTKRLNVRSRRVSPVARRVLLTAKSVVHAGKPRRHR